MAECDGNDETVDSEHNEDDGCNGHADRDSEEALPHAAAPPPLMPHAHAHPHTTGGFTKANKWRGGDRGEGAHASTGSSHPQNASHPAAYASSAPATQPALRAEHASVQEAVKEGGGRGGGGASVTGEGCKSSGGAEKEQAQRGGGGASRSGGAGDKILEGLQQKLTAVEDKVQELQQQLLARLVGGGGFDAAEGGGDDEVGDEEAVAALNDRVAKLLRMRSQIMQVFFF